MALNTQPIVEAKLAHEGKHELFSEAIIRWLRQAGWVLTQGQQNLRWHTNLESTVRYLGIEVEDALALAEGTDV